MSDVATRLRELADVHESQLLHVIEMSASAQRTSQLLHLNWQQSSEVGALLVSSVVAGELGGAIAATVWEMRDVCAGIELGEPYDTSLHQSNVFWMVAGIVSRWKQGLEGASIDQERVQVKPGEGEASHETLIPPLTRAISEFVHARFEVLVGAGDFWWNGRPYRLSRRALKFVTLILSHPGLTTKQLTGQGGQLEGVERGSVERMRARVNADLEAAGAPFSVGLSDGIWLLK